MIPTSMAKNIHSRESKFSDEQVSIRAYQQEFGRQIPVRPRNKRTLKGIGGLEKVIGEETIQIPFQEWNFIIDIDCTIM